MLRMTAVLILSIIQMFSGSRNFLQRYDFRPIYLPTFTDFSRLLPKKQNRLYSHTAGSLQNEQINLTMNSEGALQILRIYIVLPMVIVSCRPCIRGRQVHSYGSAYSCTTCAVKCHRLQLTPYGSSIYIYQTSTLRMRLW